MRRFRWLWGVLAAGALLAAGCRKPPAPDESPSVGPVGLTAPQPAAPVADSPSAPDADAGTSVEPVDQEAPPPAAAPAAPPATGGLDAEIEVPDLPAAPTL